MSLGLHTANLFLQKLWKKKRKITLRLRKMKIIKTWTALFHTHTFLKGQQSLKGEHN